MYGWQQWNTGYPGMQPGNQWGTGHNNAGAMMSGGGAAAGQQGWRQQGWQQQQQNPGYAAMGMQGPAMAGLGSSQARNHNSWQQQQPFGHGYVPEGGSYGGGGGVLTAETTVYGQQAAAVPLPSTTNSAISGAAAPDAKPSDLASGGPSESRTDQGSTPTSQQQLGNKQADVPEAKELSAKDAKEEERMNQLKQAAQQWQAQQQQWQQYRDNWQAEQQVAFQQHMEYQRQQQQQQLMAQSNTYAPRQPGILPTSQFDQRHVSQPQVAPVPQGVPPPPQGGQVPQGVQPPQVSPLPQGPQVPRGVSQQPRPPIGGVNQYLTAAQSAAVPSQNIPQAVQQPPQQPQGITQVPGQQPQGTTQVPALQAQGTTQLSGQQAQATPGSIPESRPQGQSAWQGTYQQPGTDTQSGPTKPSGAAATPAPSLPAKQQQEPPASKPSLQPNVGQPEPAANTGPPRSDPKAGPQDPDPATTPVVRKQPQQPEVDPNQGDQGAKVRAYEQAKKTLAEFERQLGAWNNQFEDWRAQNVDHPDRDAYARYEKQWQTWRDQLVSRHDQMKRLCDEMRLGFSDPSEIPSLAGKSEPKEKPVATGDVRGGPDAAGPPASQQIPGQGALPNQQPESRGPEANQRPAPAGPIQRLDAAGPMQKFDDYREGPRRDAEFGFRARGGPSNDADDGGGPWPLSANQGPNFFDDEREFMERRGGGGFGGPQGPFHDQQWNQPDWGYDDEDAFGGMGPQWNGPRGQRFQGGRGRPGAGPQFDAMGQGPMERGPGGFGDATFGNRMGNNNNARGNFGFQGPTGRGGGPGFGGRGGRGGFSDFPRQGPDYGFFEDEGPCGRPPFGDQRPLSDFGQQRWGPQGQDFEGGRGQQRPSMMDDGGFPFFDDQQRPLPNRGFDTMDFEDGDLQGPWGPNFGPQQNRFRGDFDFERGGPMMDDAGRFEPGGGAGPFGGRGRAGPMAARGRAGPMGARGPAGPMGARGPAGPVGTRGPSREMFDGNYDGPPAARDSFRGQQEGPGPNRGAPYQGGGGGPNLGSQFQGPNSQQSHHPDAAKQQKKIPPLLPVEELQALQKHSNTDKAPGSAAEPQPTQKRELPDKTQQERTASESAAPKQQAAPNKPRTEEGPTPTTAGAPRPEGLLKLPEPMKPPELLRPAAPPKPPELPKPAAPPKAPERPRDKEPLESSAPDKASPEKNPEATFPPKGTSVPPSVKKEPADQLQDGGVRKDPDVGQPARPPEEPSRDAGSGKIIEMIDLSMDDDFTADMDLTTASDDGWCSEPVVIACQPDDSSTTGPGPQAVKGSSSGPAPQDASKSQKADDGIATRLRHLADSAAKPTTQQTPRAQVDAGPRNQRADTRKSPAESEPPAQKRRLDEPFPEAGGSRPRESRTAAHEAKGRWGEGKEGGPAPKGPSGPPAKDRGPPAKDRGPPAKDRTPAAKDKPGPRVVQYDDDCFVFMDDEEEEKKKVDRGPRRAPPPRRPPPVEQAPARRNTLLPTPGSESTRGYSSSGREPGDQGSNSYGSQPPGSRMGLPGRPYRYGDEFQPQEEPLPSRRAPLLPFPGPGQQQQQQQQQQQRPGGGGHDRGQQDPVPGRMNRGAEEPYPDSRMDVDPAWDSSSGSVALGGGGGGGLGSGGAVRLPPLAVAAAIARTLSEDDQEIIRKATEGLKAVQGMKDFGPSDPPHLQAPARPRSMDWRGGSDYQQYDFRSDDVPTRDALGDYDGAGPRDFYSRDPMYGSIDQFRDWDDASANSRQPEMDFEDRRAPNVYERIQRPQPFEDRFWEDRGIGPSDDWMSQGDRGRQDGADGFQEETRLQWDVERRPFESGTLIDYGHGAKPVPEFSSVLDPDLGETGFLDLPRPAAVSRFCVVETIDYGHGQKNLSGDAGDRRPASKAVSGSGRPSSPISMDRPRIGTRDPAKDRYFDGDKERERDLDRARDRDRDRVRRARDADREPRSKRKDEPRERSSSSSGQRDQGRSRNVRPTTKTEVYSSRKTMARPPTPPKRNSSEQKSELVLIGDLLGIEGRRNRPPRIVIILRGPPGSGKTFAAKLIKDKEVESGGSAPRMLCLDDYFMVEGEKMEKDPETGKTVKVLEYEYEPEMEEAYRSSLFKSFKKTVEDGFFPFIIVDAINDRLKYFEDMWSFAKQKGFQVYIAEMDMDGPACHKRNIHGRTLDEINKIISKWEKTPRHYLRVDVRSLLQDAAIDEVEMEDMMDEDDGEETKSKGPGNGKRSKAADKSDIVIELEVLVPSKWENFEATEEKLDKLDGLRSVKRKRDVPQSLEDYLQLPDDYEQRASEPGKKRVRWADIEEGKNQERRRAMGFVIGQTDWKKLTDPTHAQKALTKTKYI